VAVNAFNRTQHLNDLYVSVFRASNKVHWPGNIKKYTIADAQIVDKYSNPAVDPSTGYFSDTSHNFWNGGSNSDGANVMVGGAANLLPDPALRRVYTNLGAADLTAGSNALSTANELAFTIDDFGLAGDPGDPSVRDMIEWIRGVDVRDEDGDPTTTARTTMGDSLHAQPASIVYGVTGDQPDIVVYTATNDGLLHAIDASTGAEMWSFMPHELLARTGELFFNETVDYKNYGLDGDIVPVIADRNKYGNIVSARTSYLFSACGGWRQLLCLDVTDRRTEAEVVQMFPADRPVVVSPVIARVNVESLAATSPDKAVIVLGGGYDTVHDQAIHPASPDVEGSAIFMLDLETGSQIWRAGADTAADLPLTKMTRAIPARIRVLDLNGDGFADRMYAADLGGQVWRFDIRNGLTAPNLVAGGVIARFGAEGLATPSAAETRRFYTSPDVSLFHDYKQDRRFLAISIGSGYREHPLDSSAEDRFYSLRDANVFTGLTQLQYDSYDIATDADMVEISGTYDVDISSADRGWKFTLPVGQKILSDSQTFADSVFFVSFEPTVGSADPCQAGLSVNRLYRVNVSNGDPVVALETLDPNDAEAIDASRVTELEQGGIAPKPSFLFPSPTDPDCEGEQCSPPPIGCVGVECFDPGFANNPVRTLWTQDGIE
jgi:type IV pilus assembly protein PilY1